MKAIKDMKSQFKMKVRKDMKAVGPGLNTALSPRGIYNGLKPFMHLKVHLAREPGLGGSNPLSGCYRARGGQFTYINGGFYPGLGPGGPSGKPPPPLTGLRTYYFSKLESGFEPSGLDGPPAAAAASTGTGARQ